MNRKDSNGKYLKRDPMFHVSAGMSHKDIVDFARSCGEKLSCKWRHQKKAITKGQRGEKLTALQSEIFSDYVESSFSPNY